MQRTKRKIFLSAGLIALQLGYAGFTSSIHADEKPTTAAPVKPAEPAKATEPAKVAAAKDTTPKRPNILTPAVVKALYDKVTPSLVAVQYTFSGELGRQEIIGPGIVVGSTGLVMTSMAMVPPQLPNEQMIDFKILVPGDAETEIEAVFEGRDERTGVAFVKTKLPQSWKAIEFVDAKQDVGDPLMSVGLLPKSAGYHSYITQSTVAANLRGPIPQTLVNGGMAALGSPVFDIQGRAIGMINHLADQPIILNDPRSPMGSVNNPPTLYVPARDFMQSITNPPKSDESMKLPWLGISQMAGVNKEVSEFLKLNNQPAVQIGAVIPGFAGEKAKLKAGDIILKLNGQPLERGDEPEEAAQILLRKVRRMAVGSTITFSILKPTDTTGKTTDVTVTLEERPKQVNIAERFFADDLGFSVREMVFEDRYDRKLKPEFNGVMVAVIKPASSANSGHLAKGDIVTQLNRTPVTDIKQFKKQYEEFRKASPKEAVVLEVLRGVNTEIVRIEPPQ